MLIPKYRFPEFKEDWLQTSLGEVVEENLEPIPIPQNGYTRVGIYCHAKGTFQEYVPEGKGLDVDTMYVVHKDNLIVNITFAWEHAIAITKEEDEGKIVSHRFPTYKFKEGQIPAFYKYLILDKRMEYNLMVASPGGAGRNRVLNKEQFLQIPIKIPSTAEQQKISDFLSCIDSKIKNQERIVKDYEDMKKGLIQKLFSQQIRFKKQDGSNYPDWKLTSIGEVMTSLEYGLSVPSKKFDGKNKYIRITDIDDNTHQYLNDDVVSPDGNLLDKFLVKENDLLFARTGASVGKTYLYNPKDGKMYFAGYLIRGHIKEDYDSYFIFLQTISSNYKNWVKKISMRSGQPGLNKNDYEKFSFMCPSSIEEQNKISSAIKTFQSKILIEQQILEDYKTLKKALLQQMFP